MISDYVLTEKCDESSKKIDKQRVIEHIKSIFPSTTSNYIVVHENNKEYELPYSVFCTSATEDCGNAFVYSIHLKYESSNNRNCAKTLEKVHSALIEYFYKDKKFHLIIANDGLSEYYCNKAYPVFQKFERLLRNLIFIVVAKAYGEKWGDETLPKELRPKINLLNLL